MIYIFIVVGCVWSVLIGLYLKGKSKQWMPTVLTSAAGLIYLYSFFNLYRRGLSEFRLALAALIGVAVIFMIFGLLENAFALMQSAEVSKAWERNINMILELPQRLRKKGVKAAKQTDAAEISKQAEQSEDAAAQASEEVELKVEYIGRQPEETAGFLPEDAEKEAKYMNVLKRSQSFEQRGSFKVALRLYQDCLNNLENEQLLNEAEKGVTRCRKRIST